MLSFSPYVEFDTDDILPCATHVLLLRSTAGTLELAVDAELGKLHAFLRTTVGQSPYGQKLTHTLTLTNWEDFSGQQRWTSGSRVRVLGASDPIILLAAATSHWASRFNVPDAEGYAAKSKSSASNITGSDQGARRQAAAIRPGLKVLVPAWHAAGLDCHHERQRLHRREHHAVNMHDVNLACPARTQTCDDLFNVVYDASNAALASTYNLNSFDHVVYDLPSQRANFASCGWLGMAVMGGQWIYMNGNCFAGTTMHEMGHNYNLDHSGAYDTNGQVADYGDGSCIMGYQTSFYAPYNANGTGGDIKCVCSPYQAYLAPHTTCMGPLQGSQLLEESMGPQPFDTSCRALPPPPSLPPHLASAGCALQVISPSNLPAGAITTRSLAVHWTGPTQALRLTGWGSSDFFLSYQYDGGPNIALTEAGVLQAVLLVHQHPVTSPATQDTINFRHCARLWKQLCPAEPSRDLAPCCRRPLLTTDRCCRTAPPLMQPGTSLVVRIKSMSVDRSNVSVDICAKSGSQTCAFANDFNGEGPGEIQGHTKVVAAATAVKQPALHCHLTSCCCVAAEYLRLRTTANPTWCLAVCITAAGTECQPAGWAMGQQRAVVLKRDGCTATDDWSLWSVVGSNLRNKATGWCMDASLIGSYDAGWGQPIVAKVAECLRRGTTCVSASRKERASSIALPCVVALHTAWLRGPVYTSRVNMLSSPVPNQYTNGCPVICTAVSGAMPGCGHELRELSTLQLIAARLANAPLHARLANANGAARQANTAIAFDDDSSPCGGTLSRVTFTAASGVAYWVVVEGFGTTNVRAHSGIIGNEGADALAKHAALHPEQANTLEYHPTTPKERGIWLNNGTDSENLAPLPDCRHSVRAHMHSKHKLGLANQDNIYYQLTQDITKAAANGAGERVMTDATISTPAQRTALLYRTRGLYNQKLAMLRQPGHQCDNWQQRNPSFSTTSQAPVTLTTPSTTITSIITPSTTSQPSSASRPPSGVAIFNPLATACGAANSWNCRGSRDFLYLLPSNSTARTITLDTCVSGVAAWDSFLYVIPTAIAFDDDSSPCGGTLSRVTFTAASGVAYWVVVEGFGTTKARRAIKTTDKAALVLSPDLRPLPWWYVFECQRTRFRTRFLEKMLKERLARTGASQGKVKRDDTVRACTVANATCDCDFDQPLLPATGRGVHAARGVRAALIGCTIESTRNAFRYVIDSLGLTHAVHHLVGVWKVEWSNQLKPAVLKAVVLKGARVDNEQLTFPNAHEMMDGVGEAKAVDDEAVNRKLLEKKVALPAIVPKEEESSFKPKGMPDASSFPTSPSSVNRTHAPPGLAERSTSPPSSGSSAMSQRAPDTGASAGAPAKPPVTRPATLKAPSPAAIASLPSASAEDPRAFARHPKLAAPAPALTPAPTAVAQPSDASPTLARWPTTTLHHPAAHVRPASAPTMVLRPGPPEMTGAASAPTTTLPSLPIRGGREAQHRVALPGAEDGRGAVAHHHGRVGDQAKPRDATRGAAPQRGNVYGQRHPCPSTAHRLQLRSPRRPSTAAAIASSIFSRVGRPLATAARALLAWSRRTGAWSMAPNAVRLRLGRAAATSAVDVAAHRLARQASSAPFGSSAARARCTSRSRAFAATSSSSIAARFSLNRTDEAARQRRAHNARVAQPERAVHGLARVRRRAGSAGRVLRVGPRGNLGAGDAYARCRVRGPLAPRHTRLVVWTDRTGLGASGPAPSRRLIRQVPDPAPGCPRHASSASCRAVVGAGRSGEAGPRACSRADPQSVASGGPLRPARRVQHQAAHRSAAQAADRRLLDRDLAHLISSPGHMPAGPEPDAPEPEFSLASGSTELSTALAEYCKSIQLLPQDHPTSQRALKAFRTDRGTPRSIALYPSGSRSADPKHNTLNTESCRLIIASLCDAFPEGYVLGPLSHLLDNRSTLTLKDMHHTEHNYTGFITTLTNLLRKDFGLKFCSIEPSEEPYRLPNCSFPAFEVTVTASSRDPNHKAAMLGLLGEIITAEGKLAAVPCVQQEGKGYTLVTRRPLLTCTPPTLPQVAISVQYDANFVAGSPTGQAVSKLGAKGQVATRFTGAVQYAVTKARTSPSRAHLTSKAFILCSAVATTQEEGNYLKVQFTSPYIASAVEQAGPITIQATDSVLMKWTPAASSQAQGLNTRTCLELGVSPASINSSSLDSQGGLAATVQRLGNAISSPFLLKRFSNQGTPQTIDAKKVTAEGDSGVAHFVGFYTRTGPVSLLSGATQLASFKRDSKRVPLCLIPANVGMSAALICTVAGMARSHRTILKDSTGRPITAAMHSSSFCGGGLVVGHPCTMGSLQATSQSLTAGSTTLAAAHLLLGDSGKDFTITSIHSKLEGAFHQFRDAGKLAHNTLSEAQETSLAKIFEACQPLLTAIAAYTQAEDREDKATHRGSMRTTVDTIYAHMKEAPAAPRRPFPAAHQQKGNKQRPQQPRPVDKAATAAAIAPAESQGPSPSSKREPKRQASARSPTHGASTSRALAADMEAAARDAAKAMADRTTDVAAWLFAVDLFFTISELTDAQRIVYVATLLSGHALLWYRSSVSSFTSWTCFVAAFERQFAPVNRLRHARDRLAALTQTSSVRRYLGEFTALCLEVTGLSPAEQLDRFIRGLKPSVRRELELREPTSFSEASTIADRVDAISYSTSTSRSSYRPPSTPRPPRPETAAVPMELDAMLHTSPSRSRGTRLSDAQRAALRDSKACFYCRKAGHTMKDCPIRPPRPNRANADAPAFLHVNSFAVLAAQDQPPADSLAPRSLPHPPTPPCPPPAPSPSHTSPPTPTPTPSPATAPSPIVLTALSASGSSPSSELIILHGTFAGHPARFMVDSGATGNIVSQQYLMRNGLHLATTLSPRRLLLPGPKHTTLPSYTLPPCSIRMGTYRDRLQLSMANIPNPSFDIVLGKPWLAAKNPCVDWINNVVRLEHAGSTHTLTPPPPTPLQADQLNLLSAPRFRRAARHDEVFMALLTQQPNPSTSPCSSAPAPDPPPLHPKAAALVHQYPSVFPKELPAVQDMPRRSVDHTIHLTGPAPSPRPIYRMSQPELDQLKKQLDDLLAKGFIRPSTSPFAAPVLFVRKKDGSLRLCVDFRALNQQTLKNRYPLPRIDDLLDQLSGAQVFSKIDLRSGYHQIRVAEEDIPKTAFRTRHLPAAHERCLQALDDILVFSKSAADHERHLHLTLSLLRQHQLCDNPTKCAFGLDTVDFLGHVVSAAGIQPDPTKVKAVLDWPAPQDKHQLRSFLGTANYYRRLLHHHAHRVLPLTDLLRDEQPWRWGEAEQRAFADIKAAMASSPVVRPPDFSLPFTVKTDASLFAIGAVLTQQDSSGAEYVVAYESRKLNQAQVNYPAHERELLAVLHALTTWRHYLLGRPFIVETDNSATTHVLTQSNPTGRQMRWTQRLAEFDITFVHKAGKHHTVPDALSRRPDHQLTSLSIVDPDPSFFSTFDCHAPEDPAYQAALSQALSHPSPSSPTHLQVIEGRLYTTSTPPRLYIPSSPLRAQLLHEAHDAHTAAHLGRAKTLERLQRHFYWPQMHKTVQEYVRTCDKCQRNKATNQLPPGLLQPLPIPSRNWQQVSMDFIGPLPATPRGHTMIFTVVDKLSKMIHLIPTTTTATAQDTARLFFDHIFKHHGLPEAIISDRDPKFTSDFWTSLFHLTGTRLLLSSAYHPQTDGQTERANRTVEDMLRPYVNDHKSDWDQHLAAVEFAYNNSEHAGTGFTPFYLNYGQHPTTPSALLLPPPTLVPSQAAEDFVTSMRNNLTAARSALQRSIDTQKLHADQHRRHDEFEVGDLVLLSCANLNLQTAVNSAKLQPRFVGPFKVLAKHSPVSYKLDLPSSMRILPIFHISRLRPYLSSSSFPERAVELQPSPVIIDGEAYFTVEAILGRRWNDAQHAFQYLIKWAGYDDSFNSWEWGPALAQQDAVAALIRDYTARHHAPVDDDPACQVCASRSPRPPMLLCDQCDKGSHIILLSIFPR
ncbi:hypothetical protein QJQ45_027117 [Haematococcus lacustris]|nr:hypothetical protein QJQ45_027117 [Haematococcus lacustris]